MSKLITLGSIIDKTVDHYRHHGKELIGISLWLVVAATPFLFSGYIAPFGVDQNTPMSEILAYFGFNFLGLITSGLTSLWIASCLILTIDARAKEATINHTAFSKRAWRVLPALFILSTGIAIALSVIALACLLPGIIALLVSPANSGMGTAVGIAGVLLLFAGIIAGLYILIRYSVEFAFAQYSLVLEDGVQLPAKKGFFPNIIRGISLIFKNVLRSLRASRAAVKGRWWSIALRFFIPNIIISLIVIGFVAGANITSALLLSFAAASLSPLAVTLVATALTLFTLIVNALTLPFYSLATYYLYDSAAQR